MKIERNLARLLCGGLLALMSGTPVLANIIHVNTTADVGGAGICTLRDAVAAATMDTGVNGCLAGSGDDTVVFDVSGTITLNTRLFVNDTAALTIDGAGQSITLDGNAQHQIFWLSGAASFTIKRLTLTNGFTLDGGGAIYSSKSKVSLLNTTFTSNVSSCGGAIAVEGGLDSSALTVANSTFYGNEVTTFVPTCGATLGHGGAISGVDAALTIVNSTFSSNRAAAAGAQISSLRGSFTLANTILTNSLGSSACSLTGASSLTVSGMNLVGDQSCGSDPQHFSNADPMLGPLAPNGGPTQTMALLTGSPAIDAADNTICAATPVSNLDQRGQFRPTDGNNDGAAGCDIGAYELAVTYPFTGFFAPVNNEPIVNTVNAGRAIPVKFSLGGDRGLNILAAGYPQSMEVACASGAPLNDVSQTSTAGQSSLSYDSTSKTYTYTWKTDNSWSNTCRLFSMRLIDGTDHTALFQFK